MTDAPVPLSHIKAISFDLDDTLWDCAPVIDRAELKLHGWFEEHTPSLVDRYSLQDMRSYFAAYARSHPEYRADVTHLRKEAIKDLLSDCGYSRNLVEPAFASFIRVRSEVTLYENAFAVLEMLKAHYKLAALTNGNADLERVGIAHLFDDIQAASLSTIPKPHRCMFDNTASALGVELNEILHIGDNPETDIVGGQAAGAMTVWFNQHETTWPENLPKADIEINSLGKLIRLLPAVSDRYLITRG